MVNRRTHSSRVRTTPSGARARTTRRSRDAPSPSAASTPGRRCSTPRSTSSRTGSASISSACAGWPARPGSCPPRSTATSPAWMSWPWPWSRSRSGRCGPCSARPARAGSRPKRMIASSVEILVAHVREHRRHFAFIAGARSSANVVLRHTIRNEIRLFASELATDLARFPVLRDWTTADLQMLAGLFVDTMIAAIDAMLESPASALQIEGPPDEHERDRRPDREAAAADRPRRAGVARRHLTWSGRATSRRRADTVRRCPMSAASCPGRAGATPPRRWPFPRPCVTCCATASGSGRPPRRRPRLARSSWSRSAWIAGSARS